MCVFINMSELHPHPVFAKVYGDKWSAQPAPNNQSNQLTVPVITVTTDNVIIDNYWVWQNGYSQAQIERSILTDDDDITEAALMSIISDHDESRKIYNDKITILRAACELYFIETKRAKKRLQENIALSMQIACNNEKITRPEPEGTSRSIVHKKIRPYFGKMSALTMDHGIKVIDAIDNPNNKQHRKAEILKMALEKSIDRAYQLLHDKKSKKKPVVANTSTIKPAKTNTPPSGKGKVVSTPKQQVSPVNQSAKINTSPSGTSNAVSTPKQKPLPVNQSANINKSEVSANDLLDAVFLPTPQRAKIKLPDTPLEEVIF